MQDHIILGLSFIIAIGVLAQWVAMQMKLPSILFLLVFGCVAGPITGVIKPDLILGDLLFPIVSLSVAIILFEGGTDLKLNELKEIGKVVLNMITIGVLVTWVLISAAAYIFLQFNLSISILLGAMLVVTGPTVIGPLLRHMRPSGKVGNIVKWEGIMNDPIGVIIAVLVFESILSHSIQEAGIVVFGGIIKTLFMGIVISIGFSGL
ncbi:MAG: cation:proton antiporter, partial [Candidatus Omnitrophica bacterium]|nr:cation:proton antiporter [Candidatus Omnitrophota bacterium]